MAKKKIPIEKTTEEETEEFLEQDLEEALISESDVESVFELQLSSFSNFIRVLDDVIIHGKNIQSV